MKKATWTAMLAMAAMVVGVPAMAAQLLNETFTYPNGDLTAVSGGVWSAHSAGGARPIQVTGGAAVVVQGGGSGEDDNRAFAARSAQDVTYACFDLTVPRQAAAVSDNRYFFHFFTDGSFNFRARVFVGPAQSGGDYRIALDNDSSAPDAVWAVDSFFDVTYKIVVRYDASTNQAKLWVNPASEASTSITSSGGTGGVDALDRVALRQDSSGNSTQIVDNLVVGTAFTDCDAATPTRNTTWGRMKAIYR